MSAGFNKRLWVFLALMLAITLLSILVMRRDQLIGITIAQVQERKELQPAPDFMEEFENTKPSSQPDNFFHVVDVNQNHSLLVKTENNLPEESKSKVKKIIFQPTGRDHQTELFNEYFSQKLKFDNCEYNNCEFKHSRRLGDTAQADIVLLGFQSGMARLKRIYGNQKLWFVYSRESPITYKWSKELDTLDGYMAYRADATVYWPWGDTIPLNRSGGDIASNDHTRNKTKGAFAYVSNCGSKGYDRLSIMREMSTYIDLDIFGGCTRNTPCPRHDVACEQSVHAQYRFFLAFENSLCKDYITEKFWARLASDGHFVPVVVGGKSIEDYSSVAPPNSFIHAYNFSSVQELGEYLQHLMTDDSAYNRYHEWRQHYTVIPQQIPRESLCKLCRLANNKSEVLLEKRREVAKEWNDPDLCRGLYS